MLAATLIEQAAVVSGRRVVTSADPVASAAGIAAYARGGNAFDAALSACFMETIILPMKCGLAGDVVALFRVAGGPFQSLVSVGPGCAALARGERLEETGPRSVGIPGAPEGYSILAGFGRLSLPALVAPAIEAASHGVPWTPAAIRYLHEAAPLLRAHNGSTPYMPGSRMPEAGELRHLPGLGQLLQRFSIHGANLFAYEDGERLVAGVRARGGILELEDMHVRPARLMKAGTVTLTAGNTLVATPAPTGRPRLLGIMSLTCRDHPDLLDIVRSERLEAKRRGRMPSADGTSVVTAADEDGNAVVVVHSNSFPRFGSGVVLEDGLVLNNRPGRGFDLGAPPGSPNAPAHGRVPPTTLHAWALVREGITMMGATPGGINQLPWNVQTIARLLGATQIGHAVCAPRWALDEQDRLSFEPGSGLEEEMTNATPVELFSLRSALQILCIPAQGLLSAAADPRMGAKALASY